MRIANGLAGVITAALALLPLPGCATNEKAPEGSSLTSVKMAASPELATAVDDYREARYPQAYERARTLARSSTSPVREQAAWVAGLAAYQMQKLDEAELQFMASERSQDPRLVTDSRIMMGDVRVLQNRWRDAASFYREAAKGLSGEERSRVLGYADVADRYAAERTAGTAGVTGNMSGIASTGSTPIASAGGAPPSRGSDSSAGGAARSQASGPFSLQAGAFQNEANARRRANEVASQARQAGLGEPRVQRTRDTGGREFWVVRIGSFPTRQGAEEARSRVASLGLIITNAS
ncbi:MAG: SPOR domain-containing protein [Phycisphaeraceae bacterium]|nr:SPOR domain-containing protein [Phycisphaeraceae bacterium]